MYIKNPSSFRVFFIIIINVNEVFIIRGNFLWLSRNYVNLMVSVLILWLKRVTYYVLDCQRECQKFQDADASKFVRFFLRF